ncbi:hypothetical protein DFJ73DRAFT_863359 [Zopfochytrium polystomum]|nr:hypothetical protein DFJ73DRAFT_863359 [Zopfochytrium polystomum]
MAARAGCRELLFFFSVGDVGHFCPAWCFLVCSVPLPLPLTATCSPAPLLSVCCFFPFALVVVL